MSKVAVVYHSGFGHTKVVAENVLKGAHEAGADAEIFNVDELTDLHALDDFDAIIFGAPTYMGSLSAGFKTFMDKSAGIWSKQIWKDKLAAGFTNSGSLSGDKLNSLIQLSIFAAQHSMIWVSLGMLRESADENPADPQARNRVGSFLGAMTVSANAPAGETPPEGDLKTARHLGARVAMLASKV